MAMLCIFGVCVPYTVIWPVIIYALKELYVFIFGGDKDKDNKTKKLRSEANAPVTNNDSTTESKDESKRGYLGFLQEEDQWQPLIDQSVPTFAKFTAAWCKPCQETEGVFKTVAETKSENAAFINVDVDKFDDIAAKNRAIALPLIICFKDGQVVDRLTGKDAEAIKLFVDDCIAKCE